MSQYPSGYDASGQPVQKPKGWFARNWLWFVPVVILLPVLCCCGGGGAVMWFGFSKIFELPAYKDSLTAMRQDADVQNALGTPIEAPEDIGSFFSMLSSGGQFNLNNTGTSMTLDAAVPVSGPNDSGTLYIEADSTDGGVTWTYTTQEVHINSTGDIIDLQSGSIINDATDAVNDAVDAIKESLNTDDETSP